MPKQLMFDIFEEEPRRKVSRPSLRAKPRPKLSESKPSGSKGKPMVLVSYRGGVDTSHWFCLDSDIERLLPGLEKSHERTDIYTTEEYYAIYKQFNLIQRS